MCADFAGMGAAELAGFAAGYLEAVADHAGEMSRLTAECARLAAEADGWRADADRVWRDARCGREAARTALEGIDIMAARAEAAAGAPGHGGG